VLFACRPGQRGRYVAEGRSRDDQDQTHGILNCPVCHAAAYRTPKSQTPGRQGTAGSNGLFSRFHSKNNINVLILMPQLALSRNTRGGGARVAISKTSIHRIMTTDAQGFPSEKCIFTWPRLFQRVRHAGGRGQSKHGSCSYAWLMAAAALQLRHRPSSKSS